MSLYLHWQARALTSVGHTAADICLSHSLINANDKLSDSLLNMGVPVTLDHINTALRVSPRPTLPRRLDSFADSCTAPTAQIGRSLPASVRQHIKNGAPFRLSRDSVLNMPDPDFAEAIPFTALT